MLYGNAGSQEIMLADEFDKKERQRECEFVFPTLSPFLKIV